MDHFSPSSKHIWITNISPLRITNENLFEMSVWTHGMTGGKENDGTMLDEDWATGNCISWHAAFSEIPSSMAPSSVSSAKFKHSLGL